MSKSASTSVTTERNEIEPLTCQHCKRINIISTEPFSRRNRVNKHISIDPYTWEALKVYCARYGSMNNGITMMLYDANRYRTMHNDLGNIEVIE